MAVENTNERFVEAVAKLLQLTQERRLKWNAVTPVEAKLIAVPIPEMPFRNAFNAEYEGRQLRLYERLVEERSLSDFISNARPSKVWRPYLELSDISGKGWWPFPRMESTTDLLRAVQYQVSGVDDFMDTLFKS